MQVVEPTSGSKVTKINTSMAGNTGAGPLDRNTPTIQGQSENPNKVEMTVAEDGTTTVGNYKLGKFSFAKEARSLIDIYLFTNRQRSW